MDYTQNEDGTYTVTIDGEDVTYKDLGEVFAAASKGRASDAKFREAAEIKKEVTALLTKHQPDLQLAANLKKAAREGDQEALVAAMKGLDYTDDQLAPYLQPQGGNSRVAPQGGRKAPADDGLSTEDQENLKAFNELFGEARKAGISMKSLVQGIASERRAKGKQNVREKIISGLESDPEMATILKRAGASGKDALTTLAEAVLSHKFMEGEATGLDDNAISGSARDVSESMKRVLKSLSEGSNGSISLGDTPTATLGFTGQPPKPVKRPSIDAPESERAAYHESRLAELISQASHPEQ